MINKINSKVTIYDIREIISFKGLSFIRLRNIDWIREYSVLQIRMPSFHCFLTGVVPATNTSCRTLGGAKIKCQEAVVHTKINNIADIPPGLLMGTYNEI